MFEVAAHQPAFKAPVRTHSHFSSCVKSEIALKNFLFLGNRTWLDSSTRLTALHFLLSLSCIPLQCKYTYNIFTLVYSSRQAFESKMLCVSAERD